MSSPRKNSAERSESARRSIRIAEKALSQSQIEARRQGLRSDLQDAVRPLSDLQKMQGTSRSDSSDETKTADAAAAGTSAATAPPVSRPASRAASASSRRSSRSAATAIRMRQLEAEMLAEDEMVRLQNNAAAATAKAKAAAAAATADAAAAAADAEVKAAAAQHKNQLESLSRKLALQKLIIEAEVEEEYYEEEGSLAGSRSERSSRCLTRMSKQATSRWVESSRNVPIEPTKTQPARETTAEQAHAVNSPPTTNTVPQEHGYPYAMHARANLLKNLPKFNGDTREWPIFAALFDQGSNMCGFTDADNLVRLQQSLQGPAREAVRAMLLDPRNVPEIRRALERRFARPGARIEALMAEARRTAPISIIFASTMPVYWINDAAPITFIKEEQNFNSDILPILLYTHSKQDQPKLKRNLEHGTINKIFNENIMQKPIIIYSRSKRHNYKENKINKADSNLSPDADLEIDIIKTEEIKNETENLEDARIIEVRVTSSVAVSRGSDREVDPIALAGSEKRSIATYPVNSSDSVNKPSFRTGRKNRPRSFSYTSIYNDFRQKDPVDVIWTERKIEDSDANSFSTFVNHNDEEVTIKPSHQDAKLPIVYSEPAKVYSEPAKIYSEPAKVYGKPELVYSEPAKIYSEPAKIYSEPAKIYSEPAKIYGEPAKFYSEPASLHIHQNGEDETRRTWKPRVRTDPPTTETQIKMKEHSSEQNYEVDESTSVESNGRVHGVQEIDVPNNGKKVGYVVEGKNYRKYRVEERTSDGFIVGEYGVFSHDDGSLRGVRYTADGQTHPRLIYDALLKFLSL